MNKLLIWLGRFVIYLVAALLSFLAIAYVEYAQGWDLDYYQGVAAATLFVVIFYKLEDR